MGAASKDRSPGKQKRPARPARPLMPSLFRSGRRGQEPGMSTCMAGVGALNYKDATDEHAGGGHGTLEAGQCAGDAGH